MLVLAPVLLAGSIALGEGVPNAAGLRNDLAQWAVRELPGISRLFPAKKPINPRGSSGVELIFLYAQPEPRRTVEFPKVVANIKYTRNPRRPYVVPETKGTAPFYWFASTVHIRVTAPARGGLRPASGSPTGREIAEKYTRERAEARRRNRGPNGARSSASFLSKRWFLNAKHQDLHTVVDLELFAVHHPRDYLGAEGEVIAYRHRGIHRGPPVEYYNGFINKVAHGDFCTGIEAIAFVPVGSEGVRLTLSWKEQRNPGVQARLMDVAEADRIMTALVRFVQQKVGTATPGVPDADVAEVREPDSDPDPGEDVPVVTPHESPGRVCGDIVDLMVQLGELQREMLYIRSELRAGVVALEEKRQMRDDLRETIGIVERSGGGTETWRELLADVERDIAELEEERDRRLRRAADEWNLLSQKLENVQGTWKDDPEISRDLEGFWTHLRKRAQVSELELLLAAGKTEEFQRKLPAALRDPDLNARAMELRALDLVDRGRMAESLYALRLGKKRHAESATIEHLLKGVEVAYLKQIAAKATGDGARLHAQWNAFAGEDDDHGLVWHFFFDSLQNTWRWGTGKLDRLEEVHARGVNRAAMEHNGIELMLRLRRRGMSFDEIRNLYPEKLGKLLAEIAPERGTPGSNIVENFSIALEMAFENEDVKRLLSDDKSLMQIDTTRSYYSSQEDFENGWIESGLDLVSAKNALLILGPFTKLGSLPGMMARVASRFGVVSPDKIALAEQAGSLTMQEWVYARPFMQTAAKRIAQSRAGGVLRESQHMLRALRYDSPTLVRMGTAVGGFTASVGANFLLMEGLGHLGETVGGDYGRLAGELAAGVIGLPGMGSTARLQQRWERSMGALRNAKAEREVTESVLKALRAPVHEASERLANGGRLSASQRQALQRAADEADDAAAAIRSMSESAGSAADEASVLASSARAAAAGKVDEAVAASRAAKVIQTEADDVAKVVQQSEQRLARASPAAGSSRSAAMSGARPPGAPAPLHKPPRVKPAEPPKPLEPLTAPQPRPPQPRRTPVSRTVEELQDAAEKAMATEQFDDAVALLSTAARHPAATVSEKKLVLSALEEARTAARGDKVFGLMSLQRGTRELAEEADQAMVPFTKDQVDDIAAKGTLTKLEGAGGAYKVSVDGRAVAVWKPASRGGFDDLYVEGQLISELLYSRLARRLGLRVPHAQFYVGPNGQPGVLIRWIPSSRNLSEFSEGAHLALKKQLAGFRPLQVMTGNYDIHLGNFKVDKAGRVWAIDGGLSCLMTPTDPHALAWLRSRAPALGRARNGVPDNMSWSRWLRDFYDEMGKNTDDKLCRETYTPVRRLNELLLGPQMRRSAQDLQAVSDEELFKLVREIMQHTSKETGRGGEILRTLIERRNNLGSLLNERWAGALP